MNSHSWMKRSKCALIANVNGYSAIRSIIHYSLTKLNLVNFSANTAIHIHSQWLIHCVIVYSLFTDVILFTFYSDSFASTLNKYLLFARLQQFICECVPVFKVLFFLIALKQVHFPQTVSYWIFSPFSQNEYYENMDKDTIEGKYRRK